MQKKVVKKATVKLLRHLVNGEMVDGSPNKTFADVLFINGCYLPHPSRYRVAHQMEQLEAANISSNTIFIQMLHLSLLDYTECLSFLDVHIRSKLEN